MNLIQKEAKRKNIERCVWDLSDNMTLELFVIFAIQILHDLVRMWFCLDELMALLKKKKTLVVVCFFLVQGATA